MEETPTYSKSRKVIKEIILTGKKQYILVLILSVFTSILISVLLVYATNEITTIGGIILAIFQLIIYNTFWFSLETKFRLEDRDRLKTSNDKIIESFAQSNFLSERLNDTFLNYLTLDNNINKEPLNVRVYHLHIFNLKLKSYLNEYFNVDANSFAVKDVPTAYFEKKIWERFIDISSCYYSVQTLTDKKINFYLTSINRRNKEINYLSSKIDGENKTELKKIFVVDDDYFDENYKLKRNGVQKYQKMYEYLLFWNQKFPKPLVQKTNNHFSIKVAKKSEIDGLVEDIGIFGPVYGIQNIRSDERIMEDELKIDFYFSERETKKKKDQFIEFFNNSDRKGLNCIFN